MEQKRSKLSISFAKTTTSSQNTSLSKKTSVLFENDDQSRTTPQTHQSSAHIQGPKQPSSSTTDQAGFEEPWLQAGLVIRVAEKNLSNGKYDGMTGVIQNVFHEYGGKIKMSNGDVLKLDQDDCQAIIPAEGEQGVLVRGPYKSMRVRVLLLTAREAEVELEEGRKTGHRVLVPQSWVCRHVAIKSSHHRKDKER